MSTAVILAMLMAPPGECQGLEIPIYTGQSWCWDRPVEDPNDPNGVVE